MRVSVEFLRILIGLLSLLFSHFFGRALYNVPKGRQSRSRLFTWGLRMALTLIAVCYFGVDRFAVIILLLALGALAAGYWDESRPRKQEDLSKALFPGE